MPSNGLVCDFADSSVRAQNLFATRDRMLCDFSGGSFGRNSSVFQDPNRCKQAGERQMPETDDDDSEGEPAQIDSNNTTIHYHGNQLLEQPPLADTAMAATPPEKNGKTLLEKHAVPLIGLTALAWFIGRDLIPDQPDPQQLQQTLKLSRGGFGLVDESGKPIPFVSE